MSEGVCPEGLPPEWVGLTQRVFVLGVYLGQGCQVGFLSEEGGHYGGSLKGNAGWPTLK